MWLFTNFGFFSIVRKPEDVAAATITIRARAQADLEALRDKYLPSLGPVQKDAGTDYRYRAKASRTEFASALEKIALDLDYSNFKSSVAKKQGSNRSHLYQKVWSVLYELHDTELQSKHEEAKPKSGSISAKPDASSGESRLAQSYGGVVFNDAGKVLLRKASGGYGGVEWTFAKGRQKPNESSEATALREVEQESGIRGGVVCEVPGPEGGYKGSVTRTIYYLMKALPDLKPFDYETEKIIWVSPADAPRYINKSPLKEPRERDLLVLDAAIEELKRRNSGR